MRRELCRLDLGDLRLQHEPDLGILVPQIKVDVGGFHDPGRDQHAFDEPVRVAFEIIAVLEGPGLALVAVDGHEARRRLCPHQRPFPPGREPGAAEATQAGVADRLDHILAAALSGQAGFEQCIAAGSAVGGKVGRGLVGVGVQVPGDRGVHGLGGRLHHLDMADGCHRGVVAGADARRPHDPHLDPELSRQLGQELLRAGHGAGQAVAHPYRDRRRRGAVLDHVEVGIEGRDLVDLRLGELHLPRQRREMGRGEVPVAVLQEMQVFDQKVAAARAGAEQRAHLLQGAGIDLAPLGRARGAAALPAGRFAGVVDRGRGLGRRLGHGHARTIGVATVGCSSGRCKFSCEFPVACAIASPRRGSGARSSQTGSDRTPGPPNSGIILPNFRTGRRSCRPRRRRSSPPLEPWAGRASS